MRSSYALEAELLKILPSVEVQREVKIQGGLAVDFSCFSTENEEMNQTHYQKACQALNVTPSDPRTKIGIELDGRQHFTWVIFSEPNEQIGVRDYNKDIAACESGITLIRVQQESIWGNAPHWKEFLRAALFHALSDPGGRIICEDCPNYTTSGNYAAMRSSGPLSKIDRSEIVPYGIIRRLES